MTLSVDDLRGIPIVVHERAPEGETFYLMPRLELGSEQLAFLAAQAAESERWIYQLMVERDLDPRRGLILVRDLGIIRRMIGEEPS